MRVPAICGLAAALVAAAVQAQEAKQPPSQELARPRLEMVFQRWDANHDGFLTAEELPPPWRPQLAQADKNGDKKLDPAEFAVLGKDRPGFGPQGPMAGPPPLAGKGPGGGFGARGGPGGRPGGPPFGPPPGGRFAKPPDTPPKPPETGPKGPPPGDVRQDRPPQTGAPDQAEPLRALFKRLDRDGNGQLSYEEFAAGAGRLWRGPTGRPPFGPPGFGPGPFGPPPFGPARFGPRPPHPFGPPGFGPTAFRPPKPAWWHRGVWPGLRHAILPTMLARPRGPLGFTPWGAWARWGGGDGWGGYRGFGPARQMGPPPWAGGGAAALLARFDSDQDGKLSRTEAPPRLTDRFDSVDRNRDGFLTPDELRAAALGGLRFAKPGSWPGATPAQAKPVGEKPKDKPAPDKPPKEKPAKPKPPKER